MNHDIIPQGDLKFNDFQENLIQQVVQNKVAWHIPQDEIDELLPLQQAWKDAWKKASNRKLRTQVDVETKNIARTKFKTALRPFLQARVRHNRYVNDGAQMACGIKPRDRKPTRIKPPDTTVTIYTTINKGRELLVTFRQQSEEEGSSRYGKPKGVSRCELAYTIGRKPEHAEDYDFTIQVSRNPHHFRNLHEKYFGKEIYIYARWINPRNEPGPWSGPFYSIIP